MTNSFNKTFYKLEKHYDSLFQIHGKNVGSSQQSSRSTQIKRMEMLTKNIALYVTYIISLQISNLTDVAILYPL